MADERCLETGHCAIHGEEVERRKEVREDVQRIEEQTNDKFKDIWTFVTKCNNVASNFRGQAKIVGIVATLIWGLGFIYTRNHITESHTWFSELRVEWNREVDKFHRMINQNEDDIDALERGALLTNQRLSNIENSTNRIERRLSQLVQILADDGQITPKGKYQYEFEVPDTGAGGYE